MPLLPVGAYIIAQFIKGAAVLSGAASLLTGAYFAGRMTKGIAAPAPAPTESEVKKVVNETVKVLLNLTKSGNILQGKKDLLQVLKANTTENQTFDENLVVAAYNQTITSQNLTLFQQALKVIENTFWYIFPNPLKATDESSLLPGAKNSLTKYFLSFFTKSQKRLLLGAPGPQEAPAQEQQSFFRWFFQDNLNTTSEDGAGVENNPSFPQGTTGRSPTLGTTGRSPTLGTTGRSFFWSSIVIIFIVSLVLLMLPFIFDHIRNLYEWLTTQSPTIKNKQSTFFGKFFKSVEQNQLKKFDQEAEIQNIEAEEFSEEAIEKAEEAKEELRASLAQQKQEEQEQEERHNDDERLAKVRAEAQAARVRAEVAEALARESVKNAQQAQAVAREVHVVISQLEPREPPKASFYEPPQMNRYISPILRSRLGAQRGAHRGLVKRKSPSPLTRRRSPPSVRRKMISARRLSAKRRTPSAARRKTHNARRKPKSKSLRRRV